MAEKIVKGIEYDLATGTVTKCYTSAEDWSNNVVILDEVDSVAITSIEGTAFSSCTAMTSITIPISITKIGADAFTNCTALNTLYYKGTSTNKATIASWTKIQGTGKSSLVAGAKKYLVNEEIIALPDGAEMIKSTTNKDVVAAYAIKDVKGNQIDTYYMPASKLQTLEEIANGKCKSYAVGSLTNITGTVSADKSTITNVTAIDGISDLSVLRVGDVIFIKQNDVPDYWVSNITDTKDLTKLETVKVESTIIDEAFIEAIAAGSTPDVDLDSSAGIAHTKIYFKIPEAKGISSIKKDSSTVLVDTYKINYNTGTPDSFTVSNGRGITSVNKDTSGLTDTYTITYNDGSAPTNIVVSNAKSITGISKVSGTGAAGTTDTYKITFNSGDPITYNVYNGKDGAAATISAGTVTMGDVGSTPTVTNSGTALNAVFDFNIPKSQTISYDSTNKILTITSV